ncbi:DNA-directed RNA polymerase subunit beta' [Thermogemmatispora sp.]|uniref:DNA-directed RNA polymerase subunit beta' n=1 Tax=Thermogemmatispora sp. TaxID=1968838 RepID=UPI001D703D27|nr:DNA-directed RNA polymerase subunit beta' [Thermogemmatispora sp.]MBX5449109.1 DNA-directed RNA polymerase subunit beta' [Thermogemmatispora sp.]
MLEVNDFNAIRISLASPEQIRSWSYGEVTKPETINYRTLRPEKDGLFCERIFGPTKDWECYCGKYKRVRFKGIVCDKCGVEVARSKVRRERMGHIELASPVSHIWYFKGIPSRIGLLLDLSPRNLERILYFALYVVTHIDEEARQKALMELDRELANLQQTTEEEVVERVDSLKEQRDSEIQDERARLAARIRQIQEERERDLERARQAESETLAELRAQRGKPAEDDIVYEPTGQIIVPRGEVVTLKHIELLEQVAETCRNDIAEQARHALEAVRAESEREAERLNLDYQGQIDLLQSQLESQRTDRRHRLEQLRRDLVNLKKMDLLQENRYRELKEAFGNVFRAGMGAEAVRELIADIDLDKLAMELRQEISSTVGQRRKKATKRLKVVEAFRKSGNRPEWMILTVLPVLPPELRPMVQLDGGRFATSDLNDLYRRVINRNNRLKRLLELSAPEIIIRNEKRMLQEACDALIDNGRRGRAVAGSGNHKLKSLSDMLKGKQGRFRQNLLGKRVDYSGRSVIVVGPELKLHQCGLPKRMALELFKPFVMRKLVERGDAHNIKSAKRFVERVRPEVWDVLEEVIKDHPVLLNRAPTLHRLGLQAFEAVLVEGSAIQLHPLVCSAFNADFDGDQMAVHVPLSEKAQDEARQYMMSTRNLLLPATGEPSIGATGDMVLGCFYLTQDRPGKKGEGRVFADPTEALLAYHHGVIDLQALIKVRMDGVHIYDEPPPAGPTMYAQRQLITTTVGRIIFNESLPERMRFKNYPMRKDDLRALISECYKEYGRVKTCELADEIKRLGFSYATKAGATIAMSDVKVPEGKAEELAKADAKIAALEEQYREGLITDFEKYQQTIDIWNEVTENITKMVEQTLDPYGAIYTIAKSGATKARFQQIRQLSGMRGLMASPSGKIIDVPIRGNFREGLSVLEYFISSHGARKGLADTALRTAESGYLTRRLIDVAQDVIVTEEDCQTTEGILITDEDSKEMMLPDIRQRIIGRILLEPIPGFEHLIEVGDEITEDIADALVAAGVKQVRVRSVLGCQTRRGVCRKCYGRDLAENSLVRLGQAVGIIAAQSIGEPGTQLTMRTFHTGGIAGAQGDITQGLPRIEELFEARVPKDKAEISEIDGVVEIIKDENTGTRTVRVVSTNTIFDEYRLPPGSEILVNEHDQVQKDQLLALEPPQNGSEPREVRARTSGEVLFNQEGVLTIRSEERDERTYPVPAARSLAVTQGQYIKAGTPITSGHLDPQDVLRILGREAVQMYLVKEVQRIYRNTGVRINDKHIEIIIRQMLRRVRVEEPGDTDMLPNDLVDRFVFAETNARVLAEGGEPARAQTVLLGVTKASLNTDSFLAAASFQETTRVLTEAAIQGQTDHLVGLKENVIIGKLIPAGSGFLQRRREQLARQQQVQQRLASAPSVASVGAGLGGSSGSNGHSSGTPGVALDSLSDE